MDVGEFELAEEQLEIVRSVHQKSEEVHFTAIRLLGICKLKRKHKEWDEAEALFRLLLEDDSNKDAEDRMTPWLRHAIQVRLGQALTGQNKFEEAQIELDAGLTGLRTPDVFREITFDPHHDDPIDVALQAHIDLCMAMNRKDEALKWEKELTAWEAEKKELLARRDAISN